MKFAKIFLALLLVLVSIPVFAKKKGDKKKIEDQTHTTSVAPKAPEPPKEAEYDGYCIPDGIDAKDGKPNVITCKTSDGRTTIYDRRKEQ